MFPKWQGDMTAWNGLYRSPIRRRKPQPVASSIIAGKPWPAAWMSEADWQETVIAWAMFGDRETEYWHCTRTERSRSGWFDLAIFQPTRKVGVLAELKARDKHGKSNSPSKAQWKFIAAASACGYDVRSWEWPDDAREAWELLTGRPYEEQR